MNFPTLYILCGLPFSGKTVLAKKIAESLDFALVTVDDIVFSWGYDWINNKISNEDLQRLLTISYEKTLGFLESGKDVVYDWANQEREKRDILRVLANEQGFVSKIIHVDVSLQTVKSRWQENKKTKKRFDISKDVFQYAVHTYELPSQDENVITYTQDMDIDTWFLRNFNCKILDNSEKGSY